MAVAALSRLRAARLDLPVLWAGLRAEVAAQADHLALWTPVAFGAGAAGYFGLKHEPALWAAVAPAAVAAVLAIAAAAWGRSVLAVVLSTLLAFGLGGFAMGKLSTEMVRAPVVPSGYGVGKLQGWVVDVSSPSSRRGRLLIAPLSVERLSPAQTPRRLRVVVDPEAVFAPGSRVEMTALLNPPPRPAIPGGYDFARDAWFEQIGGVGLALRQPRETEAAGARPDLPTRLQIAANRARWSLSNRLAEDLGAVMGQDGLAARGLAVTVATSFEGWLDVDDAEALRGSGLAHMLAIAGLHTAAVSGFVFAALRLLIAAVPRLALRVPGKKVAAAGALLIVLTYLLFSGAHAPAKRAAITAAVAYLAILLDRQAISLRSLAMAALAILLLQPEAVVQPGFQMSFSATAALVALAEVWPRHPRLKDAPLVIRALQNGRDALLALLMVSVVAGLATAPFAMQHFNRMAFYGPIANLTADFIASAGLMPALTLTALGEAVNAPLWLLAPTLAAVTWTADAILWIARACAGAPFAQATVASAPPVALVIAFAGILFACLWKGRLRWAGLPLACAVLVWPRPAAPLAWIANDGNAAAVASAGEVVPLKPGQRQYALDLWTARRGLRASADPEAARDALFDCDRKLCLPRRDTEPALGAWWSTRAPAPAQLATLCLASDIVVLRAETDLPQACEGRTVLTPEAFDHGGAAEVWGEGDGYRLTWSEPLRGERPWTAKSRLSGSDE